MLPFTRKGFSPQLMIKCLQIGYSRGVAGSEKCWMSKDTWRNSLHNWPVAYSIKRAGKEQMYLGC